MLPAISAPLNTVRLPTDRRGVTGAGFSQAFDQAAQAQAPDAAGDLATALADFRKEASLSPAQRARRDVLKSMDLTEDALKAMPADQRQAIEEKIAAAVAHRLKLQAENQQQRFGGVT